MVARLLMIVSLVPSVAAAGEVWTPYDRTVFEETCGSIVKGLMSDSEVSKVCKCWRKWTEENMDIQRADKLIRIPADELDNFEDRRMRQSMDKASKKCIRTQVNAR